MVWVAYLNERYPATFLGLAMTLALFGSISGNPVSNVATPWVSTIPLMRRGGYIKIGG